MKKSPVIPFLVFFVSVNVVTSREHDGTEDRIVGGYNITIVDVPYQVYLEILKDNKYYVCGGSIISKEYVLTAAHCLKDATEVSVIIGTTDLLAPGPIYETKSFSIHPSYNKTTLDYDVGLVHIPEGIKLEEAKAKMIKLPSAGTALVTRSKLLVTGWGSLRGDSGGPAVSLESGTQIGITSFGQGCGRPGKPGMYTRIANRRVRKYIKDKSGV